mgnify:FL=1
MGKRKDGELTGKQLAFCHEVSNGSTLTESYSKAYSADNMSRRSIQVESSKLAANPDITLTIQRLNDEKVRRESQSALALSISDKTRVLEKLRDWMDTAEPSDTNRIQSAKLLGQTVGLFKDVTITEDARSSDDIARQLEDRLANLLEGSDNEGVTSEQEQGNVH